MSEAERSIQVGEEARLQIDSVECSRVGDQGWREVAEMVGRLRKHFVQK